MRLNPKCKIIVIVIGDPKLTGSIYRIKNLTLYLRYAKGIKGNATETINNSDAHAAFVNWKNENKDWSTKDYPDIKSIFAAKYGMWNREEILIIKTGHGISFVE